MKKFYCITIGVIAVMLSSITTAMFWCKPQIFADYEQLAQQRLAQMTLGEKISQILLVRYPDQGGLSELAKYQFGGYLFFAKDFADKITATVQAEIQALQKVAKIPILTAVDEEGGSVVRISSNTNLAPARFQSPQELYQQGGLEAIKADTLAKSQLLQSLGINLNLAPVVDVSTSPGDYMYDRSLGQDTETTAQYARTVITASKEGQVSYTLKHFPGYGNNSDTHQGSSTDDRIYAEIMQRDLLAFRAGIIAGAEAVLVSHNIVSSIDAHNPASLSPAVHQLLRNQLNFSGVIITDDIAMGAVTNIDNASVKAVLAGNDLIITTDYQRSITEIKTAIEQGSLDMSLVNQAAQRVLAWKYYKGMMVDWCLIMIL